MRREGTGLFGDGILEYDAIIPPLVASLAFNGLHFPLLERTGKCIVFYAPSEEDFYRGIHSLRSILGQEGSVDYGKMSFTARPGASTVRLERFLAAGTASRDVLEKAYARCSGVPGQDNSVRIKSADVPALPLNVSALEVFVRFFESFLDGDRAAVKFGDWAFHMRDKGHLVDGAALKGDLEKSGLLSAWKTFAAAAVLEGLCGGEDMPLYDPSFLSKARRAIRSLTSSGSTKSFALRTFPLMALRNARGRQGRGSGCFARRRARSLARARFNGLLRAGLWKNAADTSLFRGYVDWNAIYELAEQQAVVGPVSDGIATLAPGYGPAESDQIRFASDVMAVEKRNMKVDEFIPKVMKFLTDNGLRPVLVKGQGLAREWPVPSHRSPGDVDLLLSKEDYASAKDLLSPRASHVGDEAEGILHQDYKFGKIELEIHGSLSTWLNSKVDSVLSGMQDAILSDGGTVTVSIGGYDCPVPAYDYNAAYTFIHLCKHYFFEGLGLRQLCDWALYLAGHKDDTDFSKAVDIVRRAGLEGPWKVLGKMVVDYLGLDPSLMPLYDEGESSRASKAWKYVLKRGNFGVNDHREARTEEKKIARKLHTFMIYFPYFTRQACIFPREALSFFGYFVNKGLKGF